MSSESLRRRRWLEITNLFRVHLKITALHYELNGIEISDFQSGKMLEVNETKSILSFRLPSSVSSTLQSFRTYVMLEFNHSFMIPIHFQLFAMKLLCAVNEGDFKLCSELAEEDPFHFRARGVNQSIHAKLSIRNSNPAGISILKLTPPSDVVEIFDWKGKRGRSIG